MPKTVEPTDNVEIVREFDPPSILLAEDSPIYRRLIEKQLRDWGLSYVLVEDGKQAWKLLSGKGAPRLAVLDWVLPEIDGVEICRRLRMASTEASYTYTILLTAKSERKEMLEAMNAGADDFLAKPFDPAELKARLLVGKRIVDLQQKLVATNRALQFAACHDFLTGLWNRAEIINFLRRELERARRDRTPVGLVLADVDHFKTINDKLGHESGDSVLKAVGECLTSCLRSYDGVGRYGGEEFLLVIPGCDLEITVRRANQIREIVANTPISAGPKTSQVTISMGVVVAEGSCDVERLIHRADLALYQAKSKGRNRVEKGESALVASNGI
ncbi:MAG TPA: diguanylate cyclase [Candidatus Sulfotelmatobacter sp.]|jgi:diguanylate cyclase (GGDEF)-like protein